MIFMIGDIDMGKLMIPPEISDTFRSQSVNYTLNGSAVIDRISEFTKKRISVQIPLIPSDKWAEIKAIITPMSFPVAVDDSTYTMRLDGDIPTPVIYTTEGGYLCGDISLVFEEV
ncbi:MAG: hypothetical protein J6A16_06870 [Oscillospiraceae bacterium]|nr:hypothetical protein [Oscillospiraceae bacterium]